MIFAVPAFFAVTLYLFFEIFFIAAIFLLLVAHLTEEGAFFNSSVKLFPLYSVLDDALNFGAGALTFTVHIYFFPL